MKKLVTVVILAILLVGVSSIGLDDTHVSVADTSIPNNEVASTLSMTINSSESSVIMIARTTASGEGDSNGL